MMLGISSGHLSMLCIPWQRQVNDIRLLTTSKITDAELTTLNAHATRLLIGDSNGTIRLNEFRLQIDSMHENPAECQLTTMWTAKLGNAQCPVTGVTFLEAERALVFSGDGSFSLVTTLNGSILTEVGGHLGWIHAFDCYQMEEEANTYLLVTVGEDGAMNLWNVSAKNEVILN